MKNKRQAGRSPETDSPKMKVRKQEAWLDRQSLDAEIGDLRTPDDLEFWEKLGGGPQAGMGLGGPVADRDEGQSNNQRVPEFDKDGFFEENDWNEDEMRGNSSAACDAERARICQDKLQEGYRFGFTNNEFIYFLATIDPIEFIVVVTVIAIIFNAQFNLEELFVVNRFITSLRDGIDILLNQRINLRLVCDILQSQTTDDDLQEQLAKLKKDYEDLHNRLKSVESQSTAIDDSEDEQILQDETNLSEAIKEDNLFVDI